MLRITCAAFADGLLFPASPPKPNGISGDAAQGSATQPPRSHWSRYETRPVPYLDLDWGNVSLEYRRWPKMERAEHTGFKCRSVHSITSAGRTANGALRGLRNVPDMAEARGFIEYAPADFWRGLRLQLGQAVGGGHCQSGVLARSAVRLAIRWAAE